MVRGRFRIVFATGAVFVALGGLMASVHGLFYEDVYAVRYGIGATVLGIAGFVLLLNPTAKDRE